MKKISVIIPTHNRADILPRAIQSVQNQTRAVDEIIVVSDGSTDNTEEVVTAMRALDPRIQLIAYYPGHNGNYARNKGLEAATGEFIAFLDDDDEWLPLKTEKQLAVFESDSHVGLVYSGQNCIYLDSGVKYQIKPNKQGDFSKSIFIRSNIGTPSQVMVRKSVLEQTGLFDLNLGALQDSDLWIRCCQVTKIGCVSEPCINYYNSSGSNQVSANTEKYIKARLYIQKKYQPIVDSHGPEFKQQVDALVNNRIAQRCLRNGQKKDARKYAVEAWKIKPTKTAAAIFAASFFSYETILMVRRHIKPFW